MSLRTRLTLAAAAAVAAAVALASLIGYFVVRDQLRSEVDTQLHDRVERMARDPFRPDRFTQRLPDSPLRNETEFVQIVQADGTFARPVGEPAIPIDRHDLSVAAGRAGTALRDARVAGVHVRVITATVGGGVALQLARSLQEVDHTLATLRLYLLLVTLGGIVFAVGLGLIVARAALRPVERLTSAVEHVTATQDLSATIEVHRHDEVGRLAASFNAMLAALDGARRQQQQLVADASHEFRTPLTSLRTNIEVLAQQEAMPAADRQRLLSDVTEQLTELGALVGDLVELAREDVPPRAEELTDIRLDELVAHAVERARLHAPQVRIEVGPLEPDVVHGERGLIQRAVGNLLDNACKWSPPEGVVEVTARSGEVSIRDHGPGIAPEDLPHVFDRFYRAPAARSMPGSGLGLAIVRRVAELHGGSVSAETADGDGTLMRLRLPVADLVSPVELHGLGELEERV